MVRFHVDSSIANDSALRAARGAHLIFFEDGDAAANLRIRAPWLSWSNDAGDPSIPYAEFADFTLRYGRRDVNGASGEYTFRHRQVTAEPLSRIWQLMLPGLGLAVTGPSDAGEWSRRVLRAKTRAAIDALDEAARDQLVVQDSEWMSRLADNLEATPFTLHGGWIKHLKWGQLIQDGEFGPAADLLYCCPDALSDTAYSSGDATISLTRAALAKIVKDVRKYIGEEECLGEELADEVARTIRAATPPTELILTTPLALRTPRTLSFVKWISTEGPERRAVEARLLRIDLPGAVAGLSSARQLLLRAPDADHEAILLELATELGLADRDGLSLGLLRRIDRAVRPDVATLSLPNVMALPARERLEKLIERRNARVLSRELAPDGMGATLGTDTLSGGGGAGVTGAGGGGGGGAGLAAHSKPYHAALVAELSSDQYTRLWEPTLAKLISGAGDDAIDALQIALSGQLPAPVSGADPPAPAPRALFHQIAYGTVKSVPLCVELDHLVRAREHTATLLGRAAAQTVYSGRVIPPGSPLARLALNSLDLAIRNGGKPVVWGELDLERLLLMPLRRATAPRAAADSAGATFKDAYTDELRLRGLVQPGAAVFALLGSPDADVDSFASVCEAGIGYLSRNTGISESIDRKARRLVHAYVSGSIAEWGRAYDGARFSQDARVEMPTSFVRPLSQAAAAFASGCELLDKKIEDVRMQRAADTSDEDSPPGDADSPTGGGSTTTPKTTTKTKTKTQTTREWESKGGALTVTATGARYDLGKAIADFGEGDACVKHSMLLSLGVKTKDCGFGRCQRKHGVRIDGLRPSAYRLTSNARATPISSRVGITADDGAEAAAKLAETAAAAAAAAAIAAAAGDADEEEKGPRPKDERRKRERGADGHPKKGKKHKKDGEKRRPPAAPE